MRTDRSRSYLLGLAYGLSTMTAWRNSAVDECSWGLGLQLTLGDPGAQDAVQEQYFQAIGKPPLTAVMAVVAECFEHSSCSAIWAVPRGRSGPSIAFRSILPLIVFISGRCSHVAVLAWASLQQAVRGDCTCNAK